VTLRTTVATQPPIRRGGRRDDSGSGLLGAGRSVALPSAHPLLDHVLVTQDGSGADLVVREDPCTTDHESARRSGSYNYHFYGHFHDHTMWRHPAECFDHEYHHKICARTQKTSFRGPIHDVFCDQNTIFAVGTSPPSRRAAHRLPPASFLARPRRAAFETVAEIPPLRKVADLSLSVHLLAHAGGAAPIADRRSCGAPDVQDPAPRGTLRPAARRVSGGSAHAWQRRPRPSVRVKNDARRRRPSGTRGRKLGCQPA
jgi:hypothetical protein